MLFETAAQFEAPLFIHIRRGIDGDPAGLREVLAAAEATGAAIHICHITHNAMSQLELFLAEIREARERDWPELETAAGESFLTPWPCGLFGPPHGLIDEYARGVVAAADELGTDATIRVTAARAASHALAAKARRLPRWLTTRCSTAVAQDRGRGRGPDNAPAVGDEAPDFDLPRLVDGEPDEDDRVQLCSFEGDRPVALVFGSYT